MRETDGSAREQLIDQLTEVHRLVCLGARASGHQLEDGPVQASVDTASTVHDMRDRLEEHTDALERRLSALGHRVGDRIEGTDEPRESPAQASVVLDQDQAFLQRLALAYMRLRSAAQPAQDDETTELADRGYRETQHLIRERLSRARPRAVAADHAAPSLGAPGTVPQCDAGS